MTGPGHPAPGKPLFRKLGLEPGMRCRLMDIPDDYAAMLGIGFLPLEHTPPWDFVHMFCHDPESLGLCLRETLSSLAPGGRIWVSWYKKRSGRGSALTEDLIRTVAIPLGLVDTKVCAVDHEWSALQLVIRRSARKTRSTP